MWLVRLAVLLLLLLLRLVVAVVIIIWLPVFAKPRKCRYWVVW
jgi:hypothetical protein